MNNLEYLEQFNENDVINVFSAMIKADAPSNRDVDIIDVEMFFDEHCVAIGLDGIADLIISEYNKRAENYFGCVTDKSAKEMALSALKERFLYKYKLLEIPLDIDGEQTMVLAFDFNNVKFDVDNYINPDWYLWNGEIEHIIKLVKEKINK